MPAQSKVANPDTNYPKEIVIGGGILKLTLPACIVLNSRPGGGKSHFCRYLIYSVRDFIAYGVCYSKSIFKEGNLDYIPAYSNDPEMLKKYQNFRFDKFSRENLREILTMQSQYPMGKAPLCMIIWDDDISDPDMFTCEEFVDAVTMFRHYNLLIVICTQYINKLTTTTRECASHVGLYKMSTKRSINAAYESYGQEFESENDFRKWLYARTKNPKDYNICWKDRVEDLPWMVIRAPAVIPPFRLVYGNVEKHKGGGKQNRKRRNNRSNPLRGRDVGSGNYNELRGIMNMLSNSGDPFKDDIPKTSYHHNGFTREQVANGITKKSPHFIIEHSAKYGPSNPVTLEK